MVLQESERVRMISVSKEVIISIGVADNLGQGKIKNNLSAR